MTMTKRTILGCAAALVLASTGAAHADDAPGSDRPDAELGFHYGLAQPILTRGFNAAVDLRLGRLVVSYSHGQGLELSRVAGTLTEAEEDAGMRLVMPYSTGFGIGVTLIDQLYVMADFKLHRFEAHAGAANVRYSTATIGAEVGWRYFVWRGFYVAPVVRYWPQVWDSAPAGGVMVPTAGGTPLRHTPVGQGINGSGLFANVLVGWSFDLGAGR
jgi:hypothetical protein